MPPAHPTDTQDALVELTIRGPIPARLRVHGWSRGLLVERLEGNIWEVLDGDPGLFRLVGESGATPNSLEAIAATIPPRARELAARFELGSLIVLRMLATREGEELVTSAPTLAWLVAAAVDEREPAIPLAWLVRAPRRSLLGYALGLDKASASMVRAAERVVLERYAESELELLRFALRRPAVVAAAARLHRWSERDLRLLVRLPGLATHPYLPELLDRIQAGGALEHGRVQRRIRDTMKRARALGQEDPMRFLRRARTIREFEREHDRIFDGYLDTVPYRVRDPVGEHHRIHRRTYPVLLPPPPFPGTEGIEPLLTYEDFKNEARTSTVYAAARGECAVYRVLTPERGTVVVDLTGAVPFIAEMRSSGGRSFGREARERVRGWFDGQRLTRRRLERLNRITTVGGRYGLDSNTAHRHPGARWHRPFRPMHGR